MEYNSPQRPTLLTVLCVLTFIGSGFIALGNTFTGMCLNMLQNMMADVSESFFASAPDMQASMDLFYSLPRWYFLLNGLLGFASFAGAVLMWNMKRIGFHFYTIAQCLLIIIGMLMEGNGVPYFNVFFTGLFVMGYGFQLKAMPACKATSENSNNQE